MGSRATPHPWNSPLGHRFFTELEGAALRGAAEHRRLAVLQFCALLSCFTMLGFCLLYLAIDAGRLWPPALLSLACVPLYAACLAVNRRGYALPAKILYFGCFSLSILLSAGWFIGREPGLHFFFFLAAILPMIIWPIRQFAWIALFMGFNLAGFCWIQFRPADFPLVVPHFPAPWVTILNSSAVISVYGFSVLILFFFQRRAEADAQNLELKARSLEELSQRYEQLSNTDPLTGLLNRRAMLVRLEEEQTRLRRHYSVFSLLMIDLDHFKQVNDAQGHEKGDLVLAQIATMLQCNIREVDHVARWGGEEFLVLLPDTTIEGALVLAEKLRKAGEALGHCTLTLGAAEHRRGDLPFTQAIHDADHALYQGKQAGRNRTVAAPVEPPLA